MLYPDFIDEWNSPSKFFTAETSGSTGKPKCIRIDKNFALKSALRTNAFFNINSDSRLHSCISPDFIGGKMMAVRAIAAGAKLTWEEPSNRPLQWMEGAPKAIDLLAVVPSQMVSILGKPDLHPLLRTVIVGGGRIDSALRRGIAASGVNAWETYGMTETASHIGLRKIEKEEGWFETLPGITVSTDSRGCLVIEMPERIVTNDLATVESPSRFRILGRADNVIVTGGKKVNAEDLEQKIAGFVGRPFAISWKHDTKWGEAIVMLVEGDHPDPDGLMAVLRANLPPHEVPKEIKSVAHLPRTASGKIIRRPLDE